MTYEQTKRLLANNPFVTLWQPLIHMSGAAVGEVVTPDEKSKSLLLVNRVI